MKKRRTLIISLLLVAALCLGIGYAGVSTILSVNGTAKSDVQDIDVVFSAAAVTDSTNDSIKNATEFGNTGNTDIFFHAYGLKNANDSVTATFTIVNNNDYAVTLAEPEIVSATTLFKVDVGTLSKTELQPDETATFTIKVTLENPSADELTETFTVNVNAHAGTQNP